MHTRKIRRFVLVQERPTDRPIDRPTYRPTDRPTEQPTDRPTDQPTNQPTNLDHENKEAAGRDAGGEGVAILKGLSAADQDL